MKSLKIILVVLLVCFCAGTKTNVMAQIGGSGSIQGTITDPNGAVVPNATVTAENVATKIKTTKQTNEAGLYVINALPPGEYNVLVSLTGFQSLVQEKVIVDALTAVGVNLTLQLGNVNETITVSEAPAQLNITDARLGTTIRNELYTNLPLAMGVSGIGAGPRNPGSFIYLLPGVSEGNRWGTINGSQGFSKDVFIEGVPITDPVQQGEGRSINLGISVESVEQFQVETSGTGVEFNGQGSENYTIKSGTSKFHGSGFEYLRNTKLNARNFFAPSRPQDNQNEFGFTIGGPIVKKKAFFFFAYDGWRYRVLTDSRLISIPTLKMRQGDFSELSVKIYDPATTVALPGGGFSRTQFPGNIIPPNRISAISKVYQADLPTPTNSGLQANYLGQLPVGYNNDNYTAKIDYNVTENHRLSGLYTHGKRSQPGFYREVTVPIPLPYTNTRLVEEIPTVWQVKHNWTINSNVVNQLSFGFNRLFVPLTTATSAGKWSTKSGLKGLPAGDASDAFLEASFTGGSNLPVGWRGTDSRDFEDDNKNYTLQDSVLWLHNKHSFKLGFQYQRLSDNVKTNDTGSLFVANFTNSATAGFNAAGALDSASGHAYASYLLGAVNSATVNEDSVVATVGQFSSYAWWVADDYKLTPRLTLNLGLRHDIMLPYTEANDYFTFLDPTAPNPAAGGRPGVLRFGGSSAPAAISCNCRTTVNTYYGNLGPRVGFAYSYNDKTVLRGSYGIMYARRGAVGGRDGARIGTGLTGINASAPLGAPNAHTPAFFWENGIPAFAKGPIYDETYQSGFATGRGTGGTLTYAEPDSQPPRYQNWNLSIQRSLTPSLVLTAAYVGSNGKYLAGAGRGSWSNQLHPRFLVLGATLLNATATPANIALAQAILPEVKLPYPTFSGTISQALRPFPQYGGISDPFGNVGQSNYNALQVTLQQRLSRGLTFNVNYTFSKALGNINGGRSAYFWERETTLSTTDQPHIFNAFFAYELPFGKGRMFNPGNKAVRWLVSNWQLSGITRMASGTPVGVIAATCNVFGAGTCWADINPNFKGSVRINGAWGSGDILAGANAPAFIDKNAFQNPAPLSHGNAPPTGAFGLRVPPLFNQDASITRNFQVIENLRVGMGIDAFNVFNNVRFGGINTNITSTAFGKVTTQANTPRVVQLKLRVEF
jgi:carboxypeptidase family protein/TonB-dependent receptor-like protein